MKKFLLIFIVSTCLTMIGCGVKENEVPADNNESAISTDVTAESEESGANEKEFIAAEGDLSPFGELVDDLFTITKDDAKKVTKEEAFEYLQENGYSFYSRENAPIDDITSPEDAYKIDRFYLKPSVITDYCGDTDNSLIRIEFVDGYMFSIQYQMEECEEQTINAIRNHFNEIVNSDLFDGYETEVTILGDEDEWGMLSINFYEHPLSENESQDAFAEIVVHPNGTLISFVLYD